MDYRILKIIATLALFCGLSACATTAVQQPPPLPAVAPAPPPFPPQKAMKSGDYAGFLAENQKALKAGGGDQGADVALFNIGFVYAYTKSPYYSASKALKYFDKLVREYPESPWSFQAKAWSDMIRKAFVAEEKHRQLKGKYKSKEAAISSKEAEINSKEAEISDLQKKMDRSREIDVEMDRKERELLK